MLALMMASCVASQTDERSGMLRGSQKHRYDLAFTLHMNNMLQKKPSLLLTSLFLMVNSSEVKLKLLRSAFLLIPLLVHKQQTLVN